MLELRFLTAMQLQIVQVTAHTHALIESCDSGDQEEDTAVFIDCDNCSQAVLEVH